MRRESDPMRNEREMVTTIANGKAYRPGLTLEEAELAAIRQPTLHVFGTADPVGSAGIWKRVAGVLRPAERAVSRRRRRPSWELRRRSGGPDYMPIAW
jgi:hypothetical protein